MKLFLASLWIIYLGWSNLRAETTEIDFDVFYNDTKIGMLKAQETIDGVRSFRELRSKTETNILFVTFNYESDVSITKENGELTLGTAYRESNHGPNDVQAQVTKIGPSQYERELNGIKDRIPNVSITFCVIDLYFEEPIGRKKVFSNMYARMLKLRKVGPGKYMLTNPDGNDSYYTYKAGKLMSIELNTKVGTVISKRVE